MLTRETSEPASTSSFRSARAARVTHSKVTYGLSRAHCGGALALIVGWRVGEGIECHGRSVGPGLFHLPRPVLIQLVGCG